MYDVLIIGSGGAGLTAALNAKKSSDKVLVVSKTHPTHSQTCQAQGGINGVIKEQKDDSVENFAADTIKASHKLGKKENIELFCKNSKETIQWLDSIGVPFSRNKKNEIAQRKFGGTKAKRTCYSSDYTGLKILHTLYDQCIKEEIEFLNEHQLLNLIVEENILKGVTLFDINSCEVKELISKTVILATGGYAGIFNNFTTNSYASTGDGIAAAFRANATLSNMEFIQFHPTSLENKNILISESARGEGGYLVDENKNRFIDELKPRDEVARAIFEKTSKGQKVYLDLTHLGIDKINETMPQEKRLIKEFAKLDLEKDLVPISPSAHYTMGGIKTDINTKTSIKNLFACGECAQSGIHGANRLGGNSLLEIVTFGKIAGENAIETAKEIKNGYKGNSKQFLEDKELIENIFKKEYKSNFYESKKQLGIELFKDVGLFREEKKLLEAANFIEKQITKLKETGISDKSKIYNKTLSEYLEYKNILEIAKIVVKSALNRQESRGAHYRIDFLEEKEDFEKISLAKLDNNNIKISFEALI